MERISVDLKERSYDILIDFGLLDRAGAELKRVCPAASRVYVVSDTNVAPLYWDRLEQSLTAAGFRVGGAVIPAGEKSKSPQQLAALWEGMMEFGLTRSDAVVALGGGVVGDLAGFAAATILRGVDFVQIPTTLLAQVDSSVGGKVAVDLAAGKNLAGAFYQPKLVLMDPDTLNTLDDKTFADGMAEVIKYGCIQSRTFFDFLCAHPSRAQVMEEIDFVLFTCCVIKRSVVEKDERDNGQRMCLNFGHTFGHAYELAGDYTRWSHGQAVAAGMCAAAELGEKLGITERTDGVAALTDLLTAFGLPTRIDCPAELLERAVGLDKKGEGADIRLILLRSMGDAVAVRLKKDTLLHPSEYSAATQARQTVRITPKKLSGAVTPPPSKSQSHRLLIAAALADGVSGLHNIAHSKDIDATARCLEELGAELTWQGSDVRVSGIGASAMSPMQRMALPRFDCGESGSTLRFLIPIALAVRGGGIFTGQGRLMERPMEPYFEIFREKGIFYELKDGVLTVRGRLPAGEYRLAGNVSSQFFTGLLFALPLLDGASSLASTTHNVESADYIRMTLETMAQFGVDFPATLSEPPQYCPRGNQTYTPAEVTAEADWSQAAFWYAANSLGNEVDIKSMRFSSAQGDKIIAHVCRGRGGSLTYEGNRYPDSVPPVAAIGALNDRYDEVRIVDAGRLRIKESDRLAAIADVLCKLGASVTEGADSLVIKGKDTLAGGVTVDSHNDHRIAMMAAILATRCQAPIRIVGAEAVEKSYPTFWNDYVNLGGYVELDYT